MTKSVNTLTYSLTPTQNYSVTNEVRAGTGVANLCTSAFGAYRVWNTTVGWKSILETRGYLNTQSYQHTQASQKPTLQPDGFIRLRKTSSPRDGSDIVTELAPKLSSAQVGLPSEDSDLYLEAQNRCLAKARDMRVNLAVATAEGRKTANMLLDAVRTLGSAYGNFRKGRFKQAARDLNIGDIEKSLANNWLAYSYGWVPFVSDCAGLAETHRQQMSTPQKQRYRVVGSKTMVKVGDRKISNFVVSNYHAHSYDTDVFIARAGLLLEVTSSLDKFRASVGLSPSDVLLTAWELKPFSFVFDWFVDIGTWLGNLSALSGLTVLDGWKSQSVVRACSVIPGTDGSQYTSNIPAFFASARRFNRSAWNPGVMTWPRVNSITDLGWRRVVTSAALLSQQFRGDPPIGKFRPSSSD